MSNDDGLAAQIKSSIITKIKNTGISSWGSCFLANGILQQCIV